MTIKTMDYASKIDEKGGGVSKDDVIIIHC